MTTRYLIGALFALVLSACSVSPAPEAERRQVELLNATVRIEIAGGGHGSGTVIGSRHILTNHHVAGESGTHTARAWLSQFGKLYPVTYQAKVVAFDKDRDLALLEIEGEWPGLVAPLGEGSLSAGSPVYVAGSPLGKRPHVVGGEVSLPRDDETILGVRHMMATAPVAPGNSGGGCWRFNPESGRYELVAVTRALGTVPIGFGVSLLPHMAYFVPIAEVKAFLAKSGVAI